MGHFDQNVIKKERSVLTINSTIIHACIQNITLGPRLGNYLLINLSNDKNPRPVPS